MDHYFVKCISSWEIPNQTWVRFVPTYFAIFTTCILLRFFLVQSWCTETKLSTLGIPRYLGSGSHEYKGKKYRFLTMDKYGKDLWKIFLENNRKFPIVTVYRIALQLVSNKIRIFFSLGYITFRDSVENSMLGMH